MFAEMYIFKRFYSSSSMIELLYTYTKGSWKWLRTNGAFVLTLVGGAEWCPRITWHRRTRSAICAGIAVTAWLCRCTDLVLLFSNSAQQPWIWRNENAQEKQCALSRDLPLSASLEVHNLRSNSRDWYPTCCVQKERVKLLSQPVNSLLPKLSPEVFRLKYTIVPSNMEQYIWRVEDSELGFTMTPYLSMSLVRSIAQWTDEPSGDGIAGGQLCQELRSFEWGHLQNRSWFHSQWIFDCISEFNKLLVVLVGGIDQWTFDILER